MVRFNIIKSGFFIVFIFLCTCINSTNEEYFIIPGIYKSDLVALNFLLTAVLFIHIGYTYI